MRKEPMFKFYCELPLSQTRTVWELLEGVGQNRKLIEMGPEVIVHSQTPLFAQARYAHTKQVQNRESWRWATKLWPVFEPVMVASKEPVRHNDPRISEAVKATGYSPHLSPIWTALVRGGKVVRVAKGLYGLPGIQYHPVTNGSGGMTYDYIYKTDKPES